MRGRSLKAWGPNEQNEQNWTGSGPNEPNCGGTRGKVQELHHLLFLNWSCSLSAGFSKADRAPSPEPVHWQLHHPRNPALVLQTSQYPPNYPTPPHPTPSHPLPDPAPPAPGLLDAPYTWLGQALPARPLVHLLRLRRCGIDARPATGHATQRPGPVERRVAWNVMSCPEKGLNNFKRMSGHSIVHEEMFVKPGKCCFRR